MQNILFANVGAVEIFLLMILVSSLNANECRREKLFIREKMGGRLTNGVISSHNVPLEIDCSLLCVGDEGCAGYNYKSTTDSDEANCQLTSSLNVEDELVTENGEWTLVLVENPCKNGGEYVDNQGCRKCKCGIKYKGEFCESERVFSSCEKVLDVSRKAKDGVYMIKTHTSSGYSKTYCQMTPLINCSGGGWTMVMKINGSKETFLYSSSYWSNKQSYNPSGGLTGMDDQETKLPTYWSTSFKELCVGMKVGNDLTFISFSYPASSLYSLIADGRYRLTNLTKRKWRSLIRGSSLQNYCNKEGFNVEPPNFAAVRIGILTNENNNCDNADSYVGFGGYEKVSAYCYYTTPNSAGNIGKCRADKGDTNIKAMGYILVR